MFICNHVPLTNSWLKMPCDPLNIPVHLQYIPVKIFPVLSFPQLTPYSRSRRTFPKPPSFIFIVCVCPLAMAERQIEHFTCEGYIWWRENDWVTHFIYIHIYIYISALIYVSLSRVALLSIIQTLIFLSKFASSFPCRQK